MLCTVWVCTISRCTIRVLEQRRKYSVSFPTFLRALFAAAAATPSLPCHATDHGLCEHPLGTGTVGLMYVNPEEVLGIPEPRNSVDDIREVFGRMGFDDTS